MNSNKKAPKGKYPGVWQRGNVLWLVLPTDVAQALFEKREKKISTKLPNTPENIAKVSSIYHRLVTDWVNGNFSGDLYDYLPRGTTSHLKVVPPPFVEPTIQEIWGLLMESKGNTLKENTLADYKGRHKMLEKVGALELRLTTDIGLTVKRLLLRQYKPQRAIVWLLRRLFDAVNLAMHYEKSRLAKNPFWNTWESIKPEKRKNLVTGDIDSMVSLSWEDAVKVMAAYYNRPHYGVNYQYYIISFKFLTGCRSSEALALHWTEVDWENRIIEFKWSKPLRGTVLQPTLKTQDYRKFKASTRLMDLLHELRQQDGSSDLVFPTKKGKLMTNEALRQCWSSTDKGDSYGIVTRLAVSGEIAEYIPCYNTRHTFINHLIDNDVSLDVIAKMVGNSAQTIIAAYAEKKKDYKPFQF